ncbi:MAG: LysR family transcriptional regulator [Hahellaceae bacterium]|nr:LysR family transcriptional regulator [Hahellaceae bacterium]
MANISRIDLNLFPVFEAIYREGSITAAAEVLHLTQPAVSHALGRLRSTIGDELFQRTSRGVKPTAVANQLITPVRQALTQLQQGLQNAQTFNASQLAKNFRLSLRDMMEALLMPSLVASCQKDAPEVTFNCLSVSRENIVHDLSSGRIDLAADAWIPHDDSVIHKRILEDHLVCLMRVDHPLQQEEWDLHQMLKWPHIQVSSRENGQGLEDVLLARHGLKRKIGVRSAHYFGSAQMASQSNLLMCVPSSFGQFLVAHHPLVIKPFPLTTASLDYYLYWHRDQEHSPPLAWLRDKVFQLIPGSINENSRT